jgi:hypothetical protein
VEARPGSAGLGFYQAGGLRCSRLIVIIPFKAADSRILLSDRAMFDVGYFPPTTPPESEGCQHVCQPRL